jgi:hypothetical protein
MCVIVPVVLTIRHKCFRRGRYSLTPRTGASEGESGINLTGMTMDGSAVIDDGPRHGPTYTSLPPAADAFSPDAIPGPSTLPDAGRNTSDDSCDDFDKSLPPKRPIMSKDGKDRGKDRGKGAKRDRRQRSPKVKGICEAKNETGKKSIQDNPATLPVSPPIVNAALIDISDPQMVNVPLIDVTSPQVAERQAPSPVGHPSCDKPLLPLTSTPDCQSGKVVVNEWGFVVNMFDKLGPGYESSSQDDDDEDIVYDRQFDALARGRSQSPTTSPAANGREITVQIDHDTAEIRLRQQKPTLTRPCQDSKM